MNTETLFVNSDYGYVFPGRIAG